MAANIPANNNQMVRSATNVGKKVLSYSKRFFRRLILRKQLRVLLTEIDSQTLRRSVKLVPLTAIGLGGTIGTGIFVLSGHAAAQYAGPSIIISFILAGIVALLSALSYSEMASMMASSGSPYTYTYVVLGEYPAFMIGWLSALSYQLGASIVVVRWSHYVVHLIGLISNYTTTSSIIEAPVNWNETIGVFVVTGRVINLPSIAITIAITVLLIIGIRETAMVNLILVAFKIIVLLIFIFACCVYVDRKNYDPFFPPNLGSFNQYGFTGMLKASTYVFFAYVGFESVATVAEEAEGQARCTPIAIIVSVVVSLLLYVGVCTVMVGLVPYGSFNTVYPILVAAKATPYGLWLQILLDLSAIASITTVALTNLLAQTRIFYAMAHDGLLPSFFAKIHSRRKTPWIGTIISGIICVIFSGICPVDILGEVASIGALITYLVVHVCVIVMRRTHKNEISPSFPVPFSPWLTPVLGILLCILFLINTTRATGIRFGVWMALGHIVYFGYSFWHSKTEPAERRNSMLGLDELLPGEELVVAELPPPKEPYVIELRSPEEPVVIKVTPSKKPVHSDPPKQDSELQEAEDAILTRF